MFLVPAASLAVLPFLEAQGGTMPPDTAPPVATTNLAPTNAAPVTNSAPTTSTTTVIFTTNGVASPAAPTNATPGEPEGPPPPGEMETPGAGGSYAEPSEMIGPPAPGQNGDQGPMPYQNNPAVTDVTGQPNAIAGLGQRRLPFFFGLDLGEMYDDNILIAPNHQEEGSFITHIQPSIDYERGDPTAPHMNYLNLYFSPTVYIYDDPSGLGAVHPFVVHPGRFRGETGQARSRQTELNRIDYNGDIYYQYSWTRLTVGFDQNYQHLTDATLDEGTLVSRNIYTSKFVASYLYNDDLTLFGTGTQQLNSYPGQTINEWTADTYALYQIAPKLSIGAGPRFSWLDIEHAPNETHQDLLARLRYVPDTRFTVSFEGGVEYLQYQGNSSNSVYPADRILPIFDMNLTYMPLDDTSLFVSAGRSTLNSFDLSGDTIDYTTVQGGASQKFLQHFTCTVTAGYSQSQYQNDSSAGAQREGARHDNYYFGKANLEWDPNQWLNVQASYQWSNNDSSFEQSTFTDNQIDVQSSVKF